MVLPSGCAVLIYMRDSYVLSDAFAEFRQAIISFVMSVCLRPSDRPFAREDYSVPTRQIFVKFHICVFFFFENL